MKGKEAKMKRNLKIKKNRFEHRGRLNGCPEEVTLT